MGPSVDEMENILPFFYFFLEFHGQNVEHMNQCSFRDSRGDTFSKPNLEYCENIAARVSFYSILHNGPYLERFAFYRGFTQTTHSSFYFRVLLNYTKVLVRKSPVRARF